MTRQRPSKTSQLQVETTPSGSDKSPVNLEINHAEIEDNLKTRQSAEEIQTQIQSKLSTRTEGENVFVPANPVALEKAAHQVAEERGFELNRGTSIGARLIARSQGSR